MRDFWLVPLRSVSNNFRLRSIIERDFADFRDQDVEPSAGHSYECLVVAFSLRPFSGHSRPCWSDLNG